MSLGRPLAGLLLCTSVLALDSRHLLAQSVVEIAPLVAYYAPSGNSINDGPNTPSNFSTPMLGAQVSTWSPYRLGVRLEGTLGWKSASRFVNPGGWQEQLAGRITTASVLALYDVSPDRRRLLWVGAGPSLVHHGGDAFSSSGEPTDVAAILALGSDIPLTHAFGLTLGASAYLYDYSGIFGAIGGPPALDGSVRTGYQDHRRQKDIIAYAAFAWTSR